MHIRYVHPYFRVAVFLQLFFWRIVVYVALFFLFCCDVELNPGPNRTKSCSPNFGHLNVRSSNVAEKFEEVATIIMRKQFHIFGLSEILLNNSVSDDAFCVSGYVPLVAVDCVNLLPCEFKCLSSYFI